MSRLKRFLSLFGLASLSLIAISQQGHADTTTISEFDRGRAEGVRYDQAPFPGANYYNYIVQPDTRNWFQFALPDISEQVVAASISIYSGPEYGDTVNDGGSTANMIYTLYDASANSGILQHTPADPGMPGFSWQTGQAIFDSLANGPAIGSVELPAGRAPTYVNLDFNSEGINAINERLGQTFAVGGTYNDGGANGHLFGSTQYYSGHIYLTLTTADPVPEPNTLSLVVSAGAIFVFKRGRKGFS